MDGKSAIFSIISFNFEDTSYPSEIFEDPETPLSSCHNRELNITLQLLGRNVSLNRIVGDGFFGYFDSSLGVSKVRFSEILGTIGNLVH